MARLGRGGMGTVYRAHDPVLRRDIALKVLDAGSSSTLVLRFLREALLAGGLRDPNLVTVFEAGEDAGQHFLAMELVEGGTLETRLPLLDRRERIEILARVARGVGRAHEAGVVHRDLKPSNILIDGAGRPRVADFGLARSLGSATRLTRTAAVLGSPLFMSPEQIAGRNEAVGPASDVWALGVLLFEALTDRMPFDAERMAELEVRILGAEPPRPMALDRSVPTDLETVCLRCLQKRSGRRYPDAGAVADELDRWLGGAPVRSSAVRRTLSAGQRLAGLRLGPVATVAVASAAVLATTLVLLPALRGARRDESEARRALDLWGRIGPVLQEAEAFRRAGEVSRARVRLEQGIAACDEHLAGGPTARAHYFRARCLAALGRDEAAVGELERALALDPGLAEGRLLRGLLRVGRLRTAVEAARSLADRVEGIDVESIDPSLVGLRQAARDDLAVEVGASPYVREADILYGAAELARLEGDLERAAAGLDEVLRLDPLHGPARLSRARMALDAGRLDLAIEETTTALDRDRGLAEGHLLRSIARRWRSQSADTAVDRRDDLEGAASDADRAIALGLDSAASRTARAEALWRVSERLSDDEDPVALLDRALADYDQALLLGAAGEAWAGRARAGRARALHDRRVGRDPVAGLEAALVDHGRAIEAYPDLGPLYTSRALTGRYLADNLLRRGDDPTVVLEGVVADLVSARERGADPATVEAYLGMARASLARLATGRVAAGHRRAACAAFAEACRLDPENATYRLGWAEALQQLASSEPEPALRLLEAIEQAEIAGRLDRDSPAVRHSLAVSLLLVGNDTLAGGTDPRHNYRQALVHADGAVAAAPGEAGFVRDRGRIHFRFGLAEKALGLDGRDSFRLAIEDLDRALDLDGSDVYARYYRARARFGRAELDRADGLDPGPDLAAARADLDRAVAGRPGSAAFRHTRAFVRLEAGDPAGAIEDWEVAIGLDPSLEGRTRPWIDRARGSR